MQVAMREKYSSMVKDRFSSAIELAQLMNTQKREEVEEQLRVELGIDKAEQELAELEEKTRILKDKIAKIMGETSYSRSKSPYALEVNRRVEAQDGVLKELLAEQKACTEAVWLVGAPTDMVEMLKKLDSETMPRMMKQLEQLRKEVLPAPKLKKIK